MAKGQTCCGRTVVSGLWNHCPFCGDKLSAASGKVELRKAERKANELVKFTAKVASLKVSELRDTLRQRGAIVRGNKLELQDRLLALGEEQIRIYDF